MSLRLKPSRIACLASASMATVYLATGCLATACLVFATSSTSAAAPKVLPHSLSNKSDFEARQQALAGVTSWAIQLRYIDRDRLAHAPVDLIVIDHARHPEDNVEHPFTSAEIEPLKMQPNGSRRLVLAYLSIGEAERYRAYWQPQWDNPATKPRWLGAENPRWPGDYQVKFADPDWQAVIFGKSSSYLERIMAGGFDGIYLDRVDAFQDVETTMPGAEDAMVGFVSRLADQARRIDPKFLIVMQNAEELTRHRSILARIDAVAKEDLVFGTGNSEELNPTTMVDDSVQNLRRAKRAGLKVFALEYVSEAGKVAKARELAQREGFLIHFTERLLGTLSLDQPGGTPLTSPH